MVEVPVLLCEPSHCYSQPHKWFQTPGAAWRTGDCVITSEIFFLTRNSSRQMLAATYPSPDIGAPFSVGTASTLCLWGVRRLRIGPCSRRILISGFDLCSGLKRTHHPGSDIVLGCQTMTSFLEKMINYWLVVCIRHLLACPAPISVLIWSETCARWAFLEGRPRFPKGSDLRPQRVRARLGDWQFVLLSLVTSRVQGHRSVSHSSDDKGLLTSVPSFPPSLLQFWFISRSVSHLFFQAL